MFNSTLVSAPGLTLIVVMLNILMVTVAPSTFTLTHEVVCRMTYHLACDLVCYMARGVARDLNIKLIWFL